MKHYALHRKAIDDDIAAIKSDWALHRFFHAGKDVADLATVAVGPMKPVYPTSNQANDNCESECYNYFLDPDTTMSW